MKSLWNEQDASLFKGDLALRVYTSRLLGKDSSLVLHGGGNTSVKIKERNVLGEEEEILYVKGSGYDLATIDAGGFSPVRMPHLLKLTQLPNLSDAQLVNELKTQMVRANAPSPSVETILHAALPYKYVDHTHADAVVTVLNTTDGLQRIKKIYGDTVVIIPYVMPGFDLSRLCAERFASDAGKNTIGIVLLNHGIFSFGDTAKESYERMIYLVNSAEEYLQIQGAWNITNQVPAAPLKNMGKTLATLRAEVSSVAGFPVIMERHTDDQSMAFVQRSDLNRISQQGTATPDHVIRTKQLPLIGNNVTEYAEAYKAYFTTQSAKTDQPKIMLDAAPRIILDQVLGMCSIGENAKGATIAADIYHHTMDIIARATRLGGYQTLSSKDIFDVEYWELEQAKLQPRSKLPVFSGEVALVTGGAFGIGKACIESLMKRGAAIIALDIKPQIETLYNRPDYLGITCDLTDEKAFIEALEKGIEKFGGLDILILNAGMFPQSSPIASLSGEYWKKVMSLNLDSNLMILRECHPYLKLAFNGGRVGIIGSKNIPAPGPGAAAYSASKAALNQLMRVAAMEWASDRIRLNTVHPNGVFDTGIWTEEVLQARAKHYGLTVQEYKTNNLLKTEVTSHDVAEMIVEMCGPLFSKTTASQVPIDGGNDRVV